MTENEAIEQLEIFPEWNREDRWLDAGDMEELVNICVKALKEIQQYRAIGTVGELRKLKESNLSGLELAMIAVSVEKQKPEKPLNETQVKTFNGKAFAVTGTCPVCNSKLVLSTLKYCYICGQAIDRGVADETST